jgi:NIMA (never in mitosis gene a)-related kinase
VYLVLRVSDNQVYAMKKVKLQKLSSKEKENALNEVRILASISHPNVIGYKEAFFEDSTNCLCIVMENADGGDVLQLINSKKRLKQ